MKLWQSYHASSGSSAVTMLFSAIVRPRGPPSGGLARPCGVSLLGNTMGRVGRDLDQDLQAYAKAGTPSPDQHVAQ